MKYSPGMLVKARNRQWVVLPSESSDLLRLKPLGGTDDEITGIYLPLGFPEDKVTPAQFAPPETEDIGALSTARLLFNASRLAFRNGAGPFRCLAKLSFRPRAYQMVPLIMALRQDIVRLLIADDVGVGKTIEALLVVKEMLERRQISRFAVVCLPHLCEQWKQELKAKFGIEAVIIRSNTQARLDREIQGDTSVYQHYPYQVISVDYIKGESRRNVFVSECPELVIVDEAHTCARPTGALKSQQQRHALISDIAAKANQHLILLTATPHSGKAEEFQSLLGLLNPDYESIDLSRSTPAQRRALARNFVQRRRADVVEKWLKGERVFPEKRDAGEFAYRLSVPYKLLFEQVLEFTRDLLSTRTETQFQSRVHYWAALALMRGIMSSPAAGIEMLRNRFDKLDLGTSFAEYLTNPSLDGEFSENDGAPVGVIGQCDWTDYQARKLRGFADKLESLTNIKEDRKAAAASLIIEDWLEDGYNPVVFCRYISTAKYVGEVLAPVLRKACPDINIQVVTSEDPDELRKERVDAMSSSKKRVLICTDCLSEGINLQDLFTAVLHYDLPWNPNRLEQREGRVDRFGQQAKEVKTYLLFGEDNPIDGVVFEVLLRKVREIRRATGISLPVPEDSQSILDTLLQAVLLKPENQRDGYQMNFDFMLEDNDVKEHKIRMSKAIDDAARREDASRSIFAQNAIHAGEIEADLQEMDQAIGTPGDVEDFIVTALQQLLGVQVDKTSRGYRIHTVNLPPGLRFALPDAASVKISFESPTPEAHLYFGRNHLFVEQLCQFVMAHTFERGRLGARRAAVVRTAAVAKKTTIFLLRARNVIEERNKGYQLVAEEMLIWGYRGSAMDGEILELHEAETLLISARASESLNPHAASTTLSQELAVLPALKEPLRAVAEERCIHLVEAHERFSKAVGGNCYNTVKPVVPLDIMGLYVLLPLNGGAE
ncbi:MAG: helicase-related protein [Kiritimatiellae bacterium]|nr:helicase-related protein [Kiritimatiellia bacterium]